jgi:hypothetical protein
VRALGVGNARHRAATSLNSGYRVLFDSPAFGKEQLGFGSGEIEHIAWGMCTKIDTVDPLSKLFDKADPQPWLDLPHTLAANRRPKTNGCGC